MSKKKKTKLEKSMLEAKDKKLAKIRLEKDMRMASGGTR